jgi:hypothetical protein
MLHDLKSRLLLASLLSALLGVMALPSAWANGNPSASGHANLTIAGGLQTYSFTAVQHKDGSVSGQLTLNSRAQDAIIQGKVTCLVITDNETGDEAKIGGIITHATPSDLEGEPFEFHVVDNGEGANDPDLVSDVFLLDQPAVCDWNLEDLMLPIEAGNINVNP